MQSQEVNFVILDVGSSMYQIFRNDKSRLQAAVDSIILLIQQKLFTQPNHEVPFFQFKLDRNSPYGGRRK